MQRTKCNEIMTSPPITIAAGTDVATAARLMLDKDIGSVLVIGDDGKLCGIVTDSDFAGKSIPIPFSSFRLPQVFGHWLGGESDVEAIYHEACRHPVTTVMSELVWTVEEDDEIEAAISGHARPPRQARAGGTRRRAGRNDRSTRPESADVRLRVGLILRV